MVKRPNDHNTLIILMLIFLLGVAMIFIPLVQQRQEIEADDSIYAMIAEEIQRQQAVQAAVKLPDPEGDEAIADDADPQITTDMEDEMLSAEIMPDEPVSDNNLSTGTEPEPAEIIEDEPMTEISTTVPSESTALVPTANPSTTKKPASGSEQDVTFGNADYIAWISIPGTVINYPVVRSDRSEYYLHHLITGQASKLGCLFSLTTSDYEEPSKNIAIYGHHLSNSTAMFSTLMNYKKQSYWESHQTIQLDTIYGSRAYRIFAVLNHTVSDWDVSTATFTSEKAFKRFVDRAMAKTLYDTGITVSEDDYIITLITCDRSYGGVQGRLLVMGVEQ